MTAAMNQTDSFPLHWPAGLPRCERRLSGGAHVSLSSAAVRVKDALRLLGSKSGRAVSRVTISSNVTLGQARPTDPGVAIYFDWCGQRRCVACDEYSKPEANLRAIYQSVERWTKEPTPAAVRHAAEQDMGSQ